ncbi:UTRA domain-containing protein [Leptolinea tardivitalis]|uniref:UTRA domain-containing protein n=1 Tax=Leptolinea tardivitalis TaxID=229920 RepID=UPI000783B2B7|nr:UTRA domain-containing protein [Leptolinea tardivitalis]GAP22734.1 transcriptional regulator [Leptolinea tardivitalis]
MHFEVDRTSSQPIYSQLASWMETKINSGEWQTEFKFPGEVELAQSLGVSRGSLRKAISTLIEKGLVVQIHGKGTFVGRPEPDQAFAGRLSVYQDLMLLGIPFTTEVLEQRIMPAPDKQAQLLDLSPAEAVFYLKRLRSVRGEPLVVQESFFPASRFGGLVGEDFTHVGMVETVERRYGIILEWTNNTISVARATTSVASLLGLKIGDPVLFTESILYDDSGNKVETGLAWFRPDRFRLKTTTRRAQNESFYSMLGRTANLNARQASSEAPTRPVSRMQGTSRLAEFLPVERICVNYHTTSWSEAVLQAGRLLQASGATEERYGQAMVNTARQLGPYFVVSPGIAVAHALPSEGVIKPALALVTLQPPLPFGNSENDPVRLLIAIAAVDTNQHVEALKDIADVLSDPLRRNALMQASTVSEAFEILTRR